MKKLKTYNQLFENNKNLELNLILSFKHNNNYLLKYLNENGNPDYVFKKYHIGSTLISFAIEYRDYEKLKLLIDFGADVNHIDDYGKTYLIKETHHYVSDLTIISILIEANADWNIIDPNTGKDFFEKLKSEDKNIIIKKYPEKYQEYLKKKQMIKYNI